MFPSKVLREYGCAIFSRVTSSSSVDKSKVGYLEWADAKFYFFQIAVSEEQGNAKMDKMFSFLRFE